MDFVFAVADWMTVMAEGTVLAEGTPADDPRQHRRAGGLSRGPCVMPATPPARTAARGPRARHLLRPEPHPARRLDRASRAGETIGLMGRNGMGKTTLIRTLVGLVRAAQRQRADRRRGRDARADLRHRPARHRLRAGGPRHLRQPQRGARTWRSPSAPAPDGQRALDARARARAVPAPGAAPAPTAATSSPAASSRCWRSAARC